jgi:glycosyltransferase involved in cell wall biosynthesis
VVSRRVDFAIGPVSRWTKYRVGVDRYIAITRAVARVLERGGVSARRIVLVPSGIDPDRHSGGDGRVARAALGVDATTPLVGSIAHFAWHKGLKYLVRAWPAVRAGRPNARLAVVGSGEDEAMLRAEARRAGVESSVAFPGFQSDVSHWLAAFDVYVQPSVMEGLGTSVLDALAAGKPVVATHVGGIPEIVEDGETGLLVPPSDPHALATAILRLMDDTHLAVRLASAGASRVRAAFTADRMVEATLAVYREVLAEAGKGHEPGASTRGFRE